MKQEETQRKTTVDMTLATFEIPPSGEALVLAKRCPIGPEAAKKMLDVAAPEQFELIRLDDDIVEGILIRKYLFLRANREKLISAMVEEAKTIMGSQCMVRIRCDISVSVKREL